MIFIDASFFLAYENVADVHHKKAAVLWNEIISGKFENYVTSDYILNEVVGVTFRKFGKERAVKFGEHILKTIFMINIDDHLLKESWKIFSKTELKLNLVDCTNLIAAKMADAEFIATFDNEFNKIDNIKVIG